MESPNVVSLVEKKIAKVEGWLAESPHASAPVETLASMKKLMREAMQSLPPRVIETSLMRLSLMDVRDDPERIEMLIEIYRNNQRLNKSV